MRTLYKISSNETGTIFLRRRKIAKALRWWLRDNGFNFTYTYSNVESDYKPLLSKSLVRQDVVTF